MNFPKSGGGGARAHLGRMKAPPQKIICSPDDDAGITFDIIFYSLSALSLIGGCAARARGEEDYHPSQQDQGEQGGAMLVGLFCLSGWGIQATSRHRVLKLSSILDQSTTMMCVDGADC